MTCGTLLQVYVARGHRNMALWKGIAVRILVWSAWKRKQWQAITLVSGIAVDVSVSKSLMCWFLHLKQNWFAAAVVKAAALGCPGWRRCLNSTSTSFASRNMVWYQRGETFARNTCSFFNRTPPHSASRRGEYSPTFIHFPSAFPRLQLHLLKKCQENKVERILAPTCLL